MEQSENNNIKFQSVKITIMLDLTIYVYGKTINGAIDEFNYLINVKTIYPNPILFCADRSLPDFVQLQ